ncbi:MAG TPA: YigZ family protein [Marmoricola sp.]
MITSYRTIARTGVGEVEVSRSRFRAEARRVADEDEARTVIAALRKAYPDARHHCTAMVIGSDGALERSSDDGEPPGTAGTPILDVVRGSGLSDVVMVVTRWFGGTLLGTGGLVRAYGDAAAAAVADAGVVERSLLEEYAVAVDHADAGRIENDLRARGVSVLDVEYAEHALMHLAVPPDQREDLASAIAAATAGKGALTLAGRRWVDQPVAGSRELP